jgi:hypothetical protein
MGQIAHEAVALDATERIAGQGCDIIDGIAVNLWSALTMVAELDARVGFEHPYLLAYNHGNCYNARMESRLPPKLRAPKPGRSPRLKALYRIRQGLIRYATDRLTLDEDWHALSDAANDLREVDVEIRMLESQ